MSPTQYNNALCETTWFATAKLNSVKAISQDIILHVRSSNGWPILYGQLLDLHHLIHFWGLWHASSVPIMTFDYTAAHASCRHTCVFADCRFFSRGPLEANVLYLYNQMTSENLCVYLWLYNAPPSNQKSWGKRYAVEVWREHQTNFLG